MATSRLLAKPHSAQIISWLRLRFRVGLGKLFNLAGVPGIVRECDYAANTTDAQVTVRVRELFTIITVNCLEIYFHRLTGTIDGVGSRCGYRPDRVPESAQFPTSSE